MDKSDYDLNLYEIQQKYADKPPIHGNFPLEKHRPFLWNNLRKTVEAIEAKEIILDGKKYNGAVICIAP